MYTSNLIREDIGSYLKQHERKELLRFITCGSVDDGKSTLIGRLLYESKMIFEDQLKALENDSKKMGTQGDKLDFALLVDGLAAEREQGITIDVAYRFFSTEKRKFIVADTPGHEQYTRNMVTGASTADLAIVLIDASKGILTQTKRHSFLVSMMGIKHIILAINKMDLVNHSQNKFDEIYKEYLNFSRELGIINVTAIPMSALNGDNITKKSIQMTWYQGPTLIQHLESISTQDLNPNEQYASFPIQWVNRPNSSFRGYAGSVASGKFNVNQKIRILPSGKETTIQSIVTHLGQLDSAVSSQAVTLTFTDEIDASRGDVICSIDNHLSVADQFEAKIIWFSEDTLHPGRQYLIKCGTRTANASITKIKYSINVNTLEHVASEHLNINSIAICNLHCDKNLVFDTYQNNSALGSFILIDRVTNSTVGAGLIDFALRRSQNIVPQAFKISRPERESIKNQKSCVLWFTGLSGSGKSTIANLVEQMLFHEGKHSYILDGDNLRHGLNKDLGFTATDRIENIRRIAEVARLMTDAGLITLVTFISPFNKDREFAKSLFEKHDFYEIYVNSPLELAEMRDPKGLYKKAREGSIKNFTGIDSPYEPPKRPDLVLDTHIKNPQQCAEQVIDLINKKFEIS